MAAAAEFGKEVPFWGPYWTGIAQI